MRLSEAVMFGSVSGLKKFNPSSWDTCLIGIAVHDIGGSTPVRVECINRWPWLNEVFDIPPLVKACTVIRGPFGDMPTQISPASALFIISGFASQIEAGNLTLERAVDWIRSVEPAEECPADILHDPEGQKGSACGNPVLPDHDFCSTHEEIKL